MKLFNIRITSDEVIQLCCAQQHVSSMVTILDKSELVVAFNVPGVITNAGKYSDNLFKEDFTARFISAIKACNSVPKPGTCLRENFVGSPGGPYEPPECDCATCVERGLGWNHRAYNVEVEPTLWDYMYNLLKGDPAARAYRWGIEYHIPNKIRVSIYNQGTCAVCSNQETIAIGCYWFYHQSRTFLRR